MHNLTTITNRTIEQIHTRTNKLLHINAKDFNSRIRHDPDMMQRFTQFRTVKISVKEKLHGFKDDTAKEKEMDFILTHADIIIYINICFI